MANYGPTATLFTLGRNYTAQQYDINPNAAPIQVQSVQHVPANTPPTPPTTLEEQNKSHGEQEDAADARRMATLTDVESSADEDGAMSPLQKIAREMETLDQLESEIRDKVMPLSPVSSRTSSVSSTKSSQGAQRQQKYLYDRPPSSRASTATKVQNSRRAAPPSGKAMTACRSDLAPPALPGCRTYALGHPPFAKRSSEVQTKRKKRL
jgi:hypothetical protein